MSSTTRSSVSTQPLDYADISVCAQITSSAFAVDPHTIVKSLGREPYDMHKIMSSMLLHALESRKQLVVKAVDEETGEVIGHAGWVFIGVDEALIPRSGPRDDKSAAEQGKSEDQDRSPRGSKEDGAEKKEEEDSIDRLMALEDRDMAYWQSHEIPKDKPYAIVTGLHVSIAHQSRGVGSALLRYGNAVADGLGLSIWVHSSHQAYEAYKKMGFETMRSLEIDLDEWAPRGPRDDEAVMGDQGSGKWGKYIIRYMKRDPVKQ